MPYHGKSIDTFEDAAAMLLSNSGYEAIPHMDCISLRCFSFQVNERDWKNWLIPVIDHKHAVARLFSCCGLADYVELGQERENIWEMMEQGCLVGPVGELRPYGIYSLYYDGRKKYLYVCGRENGLFIVHDPDGFPMRLLNKEEFTKYYDLNGAAAVRIKIGGRQKKEIDYLQILREGLYYRRTENLKSEDVWEFFFSGQAKRSQSISALCGLYNYLLQTSKIVRLAESLGNVQKGSMLKELYRCIEHRDAKQFVKLKEEMFIDLEQAAGLSNGEET